MADRLRRPVLSVAIGLAWLLAAAAPATAAKLRVEGRQTAIAECKACHRVTVEQTPPAPVYDPDEGRAVAAPSFDAIARRYKGRPGLLRAFIQAPRHPMREQQFLKRDLLAITRYIGSLTDQHWAAPKPAP